MAKKAVKVVRKLVMVVGPHRGGGVTASQIKSRLGELKVTFNELIDGSAVADFYQGTARTLYPRSFDATELPQLFVLEQTQPDGEVAMVSASSGATLEKAMTVCRVFFGVKWSVVPPVEAASSEDDVHPS